MATAELEITAEVAEQLAEAAKFEEWARESTARAKAEPPLRAEHLRCAAECRRKAREARQEAHYLATRRRTEDGRWACDYDELYQEYLEQSALDY